MYDRFTLLSHIVIFTLWLFNIAMENLNYKWKFLAGKIIYFSGPPIP